MIQKQNYVIELILDVAEPISDEEFLTMNIVNRLNEFLIQHKDCVKAREFRISMIPDPGTIRSNNG